MISSNDLIEYRKLKNMFYNRFKVRENVEEIIEEMNYKWNEQELKKLNSLNTAHYNKTRRIKKYITKLLENYNCVFVTLTFNDINYTDDYTTLRKKLDLFLLKLRRRNIKYIGNYDIGKLNDRGHFHFIVNSEIDLNLWKYGAINVKRIFKVDSDIRLAKYINKLTNHCIKDTVKFRIIRSR